MVGAGARFWRHKIVSLWSCSLVLNAETACLRLIVQEWAAEPPCGPVPRQAWAAGSAHPTAAAAACRGLPRSPSQP